jgi:hypothetical protein
VLAQRYYWELCQFGTVPLFPKQNANPKIRRMWSGLVLLASIISLIYLMPIYWRSESLSD